MKDLVEDDRPREKLARHGVAALGDNELLAVLMGHGTRGLSALALANRLLALAGGVHGLTRLHHAELARVQGLGPAQAGRVQAAIELGRRTLLTAARERPKFAHPRDAARYLLPLYGSHPVERFGVVMLDVKNRLVRTRLLSIGTLDASIAHPREVFREALLAGAAGVIVFHNHPSGDATPSPEDVDLTRRLLQAGEVVGVHLVDHVILADTQYCSMKESRVL
jgi:DNA repair protein RadC